MGGKAAHWMDCLEVWREMLTIFPDFEHIFIDQYVPLDDKNIAQDKLWELQQHGTVQENIT